MPGTRSYIVFDGENGEPVGLYTHRIITWNRSHSGGTVFLLNNGDELRVKDSFDDVCTWLDALR